MTASAYRSSLYILVRIQREYNVASPCSCVPVQTGLSACKFRLMSIMHAKLSCVCVRRCVRACVRAFVRVRACFRACVRAFVRVHACVLARARECVCTRARVRLHVYT